MLSMEQLQEDILQVISHCRGSFNVALEVDGQGFEYRGDQMVTSASLIKVPILITAGWLADQRTVDLDRWLPVPPAEKVGGSGVLGRLSDGLSMPLRDLLMLMIIVSDNTATNIAIDQLGLENIKQVLEKLGCTKTVLGRRLMDMQARKAGKDNFTSARDMVVMLKTLCEGHLLQPSTRAWALDVLRNQQFNHKLPRRIPAGVPGDAFIAHKTGELPGVEHDAAIMERGERRAYLAVLSHGLASNAEGQDALADIGKLVWDYLST